ncbi:hypothetical protein [Qipengyuania huizhouensis]|uniref:hypothetical protein n=1 Tax=Qipengyuania huizhouensis TaxID=2867245 RepID=UPI001C886516|nr:hypothetical protein [Qipengyuania huizhouensis]MBX7459537.1 hypothetical protein [Qipengyuania huizhouensis]
MSGRWLKYASRKPRNGPSVAERQMAMIHARPVSLPEGSDPELAVIIGVDLAKPGTDRTVWTVIAGEIGK